MQSVVLPLKICIPKIFIIGNYTPVALPGSPREGVGIHLEIALARSLGGTVHTIPPRQCTLTPRLPDKAI